MRKITRALRRFLGLKQDQAPPYEFAHTVSWVNEARAWSPAERARIRAAVERVVLSPEFTLTQYQRRYAVPELEQREFAGESLVALLNVLDSLDQQNTTEE
jgi:hypothetical protein